MVFKLSRRRLILMGVDAALLLATYAIAICMSALSNPNTVDMIGSYALNFLLMLLLIGVTRTVMRVYSNVWRYANSKAYLDMVISDAIGGALTLIISYILGDLIYPVFIGGWQTVAIVALFNSATLVSRFVYQQGCKIISRNNAEQKDGRITVAIVGAGRVGALLAEELLCYKGSHYRPVCFIDSNPEKVGSLVSGIPVYEENASVFSKLAAYPVQEIFVAIPQLSGDEAKALFEFYAKSGCKIKLYDFPRSDVGMRDGSGDKRVIREFNIEDLLFRNQIDVTDSITRGFYYGKTVLVTGGGGSIGSELVRQIARCEPKKLIIFDIYENNAYDIQQELVRKYGKSLDLSVEIGSVRDRARLEAVFAAYRPEIVFHAAAHKHVPLMEHSNCEAIKNNVFGTYNTADMAEKYGAIKFILISTDKAVNPTNIMGASKRMCEMVVQCRTGGRTAFSAVRFGNVLGSNGSVIPLFKRQISAGGPITITDKRIIRYFMTIPEASGLVMQAGAMAKSGELFVLDMGKPVRIYDLAENMIKLSGLTPYIDIDIIETGLRPGEKLYEELLIKTESLLKTPNDLIFIEKDEPLSREAVEEKLSILREAITAAEHRIASPVIAEAMMRVVPTFHTPEEVNARAGDSAEMKAAEVV